MIPQNKEQLNKEPETRTLVRFGDCDPLSHLNNARYLDYFLNAREDHLLHHYGLSTMQIAKETGKTWVVTENRIAYLRPANLMEEIIIQSTVIEVAAKRLIVEMRMYNEDKTQLKSVLWVTLVYFDTRTQRSAEHDGELATFLRNLETPIPKNTTFEKRIGRLKEETKARAEAVPAS